MEIAKKLGEDFRPLLSEILPSLSELLEDEDEVVEKNAQNAVRILEEILEEPLQKYFWSFHEFQVHIVRVNFFF